MKLIIEDDEGRRTVIPVLRDEITIGRKDDNMVRLTEKNVSRKHGRLVRAEGHFYIEDLDSFTGIRLNGEKVKGKAEVKEGDLIQISEYDLSLHGGPDEKPEGGGGGGLGDDDDEATLVKQQAGADDAAAKAAAQAARTAAMQAEAEAQAAAREAAESDAKKRKDAVTAVIRLSDLPASGADEAVQEVPEASRPKLVGISGSYRGKELVLDRTPVKLGRNEENDVEIDHPSISRKHCRLHLVGDSWQVMDAESRNGVRVNGEPYAAIGLRHGDVVEIGHLRFAFALPGQPFKLPPEFGAATQAGAPGAAGKSRGGLVAGAIVAAGLAIVAAIWLTRHRGAGEEDGVEVVADSKHERKFALKAADEALAAHRYSEALHNLDSARRAGASAAELRNYNVVQDEARAEDLFHEMESAAAAQDFERARKLLSVLASTHTHYGAKASEKADTITAGYVNLHVAAAAMSLKNGDKAGCLAEAQQALTANAQSADAQSLVESCKAGAAGSAAAAAADRPAEKPAARAAAPAARPAPSEKPATVASASLVRAGDDSEARKLVNDGNQKLVAQDFGAAISIYQRALAMKPTDSVLGGIYRSMGIAFTRQGNIEEGAHYYKLYLPLCNNPNEKAQLQKVLDDYEARRK